MYLDIVGEEPGDETGSFVSANSNGRVIAVGSLGQPRVVVYRRLLSSATLQLGRPFSTVEGAAPVAAALNGEGNILAVGYNDGSVRVFRYLDDDAEWVARGEAVFQEGELAEVVSFVSLSLASNAVTLVIGIMDGGTETFSVQPYLYSGTTESWNAIGDPIVRYDRSDAMVQVSPSGFDMAVATVQDSGSRWGSVETFALDIYGGNATSRGSFRLLGVSSLRVSFSMNGNIMAVSDDRRSGVYVYDTGLKAWQLQPGGDRLVGGTAISLSYDGGKVAIGTFNDFVETYEFIDDSWVRHVTSRRKLALSGTGRDGFGSALSLCGEGSTLVVGAPFDDADTGKVYLYEAVAA
jgi:hypothetical protein